MAFILSYISVFKKLSSYKNEPPGDTGVGTRLGRRTHNLFLVIVAFGFSTSYVDLSGCCLDLLIAFVVTLEKQLTSLNMSFGVGLEARDLWAAPTYHVILYQCSRKILRAALGFQNCL